MHIQDPSFLDFCLLGGFCFLAQESPGCLQSSVVSSLLTKSTDRQLFPQVQWSNLVNSPVNCQAQEETLIKVVAGRFSFSNEMILGY